MTALTKSLRRVSASTKPSTITGLRTKRFIKHTLKRLRKLWLRHPELKLSQLVASDLEQQNDEQFIRLLEGFWKGHGRY